MTLCDELLHGAIDLHQHAAPSLFERITDDFGLATEASKLGARMVWMPTLSAQHHIDFFGGSHFGRSMVAKTPIRAARQGIRILDENGELTAETRDILGLIAEADICLSTGHLSLQEIKLLVREAKKAEGLRVFIQMLLERGITPDEIRTMVATNPARLLGLE